MKYLKKMIIPHELVPFYPFPVHAAWWDLQYLLSAILIVVITCLTLWMIKKGNDLFDETSKIVDAKLDEWLKEITDIEEKKRVLIQRIII